MFLGRRTLTLLIALGLVGAPAVLMRALCVGRACDTPARAATTTPFCRLPADVRRQLIDGHQDGRSPDVFAVARREGSLRVDGAPWPGIQAHVAAVPAIISPAPDAAGGLRLDQIAPTIASLIGLKRAHPEVRSGDPIPIRPGPDRYRAVLVIGIKGWGDLAAAPDAVRALRDAGVAVEAAAGSTPADPAALFTTVGTGGLPRQHGITGSALRDADGMVRLAWGPRAPTSVIATLADDLDEVSDQDATVAMVAHASTDRGLIGDGWYVDSDRDTFVVEPHPQRAAQAFELIVRDADRTAVYALTVDVGAGRRRVNDAIERSLRAVERVSGGRFATVVVGTGARPRPAMDEHELIDALGGAGELVERTVAGGFFLDQEALVRTGASEDVVVEALKALEVDGRRLFADVFTGISLAFGRYC